MVSKDKFEEVREEALEALENGNFEKSLQKSEAHLALIGKEKREDVLRRGHELYLHTQILQKRAIIESMNLNYGEAADLFKKSIKLLELSKDKINTVKEDIGEEKLSERVCDELNYIEKKIREHKHLMTVEKGLKSLKMGNPSRAKEYFSEGKETVANQTEEKFLDGMMSHSTGLSFIQKADYTEAVKHFSSAREVLEEVKEESEHWKNIALLQLKETKALEFQTRSINERNQDNFKSSVDFSEKSLTAIDGLIDRLPKNLEKQKNLLNGIKKIFKAEKMVSEASLAEEEKNFEQAVETLEKAKEYTHEAEKILKDFEKTEFNLLLLGSPKRLRKKIQRKIEDLQRKEMRKIETEELTRKAGLRGEIKYEHLKIAIEEMKGSISEDTEIKPRVGAVAIKNGEIIERAHRNEFGKGNHAEANLIEKCENNGKKDKLEGSTLLTTLEPCTQRTYEVYDDKESVEMPCARKIIDTGVDNVIIGQLDPNEDIRGEGELILQDEGIRVDRFPPSLTRKILQHNAPYNKKFGYILSFEEYYPENAANFQGKVRDS